MSEQKKTNSEQIKQKQRSAKDAKPNDKQDAAQDMAKTIPAPVGRDVASIRAAEENVSLEWNIGDVILDLYQVKDVHKGGGMGLVYRVAHKGWNMDLAVKSPRKDYFKTEAQKDNFTRECEIWINLGLHPNIVSCYYVRNLGSVPRVFSEYVEGGNLKDWIQDGRLYEGGKDKALERILDIAIQSAWGLQYAHEQGLVHQDIKPQNILMMPDGTPKITDFGLAKARAIFEEASKENIQQSLQVSSAGGTPAYWSPEQAECIAQSKAGIPYDQRIKLTRRTDIWSWAVSVLEMFTGEVVWAGGQIAGEALKSYIENGNEDENEQIPLIPEAMVELLTKCFDLDHETRPQNMAIIIDQLKAIYQKIIGNPFPFPAPEAATLRAVNLNNRAVSLFDLAREQEALENLEDAIEIDPSCPEAVYNHALLLWNEGKLTDLDVVEQFEVLAQNNSDDGRFLYYLGKIHILRMDAKSAGHSFKRALRLKTYQNEIKEAISGLEQKKSFWPRLLHPIKIKDASGPVALFSNWKLFLSSADSDGNICLWDVETGSFIKKFCVTSPNKYYYKPTSISLTSDECYFLSSYDDGVIRFWKIDSEECLATMKGHEGGANCVSVSPDGKFALSGGSDHIVKLWSLNTGECVRRFKGHAFPINSVIFLQNSNLVISASGDGSIRYWDMASGECLRIIKVENGGFHTKCIVSSNGEYLVSFGGSGAIGGGAPMQLWNIKTGKCIRTLLESEDKPEDACFFLNDKFLLAGSRYSLRILDIEKGVCLRTLEKHNYWLCSIAVSEDNKNICCVRDQTSCLELLFKFWNMDTIGPFNPNLILGKVTNTQLQLSRFSEFSNIKKNFESYLRDKELRKAKEELLRGFSLPEYDRDPTFLNMWKTLGSQGERSKIRAFWQRKSLHGHASDLECCALSSDGQRIISGDRDSHVKYWDFEKGTSTDALRDHFFGVKAVALSPSGKFALIGGGALGRNNEVRYLDIAGDWKCLSVIKVHKRPVTSVAFSPDGRYALSGSYDKSVYLSDLADGKCLKILQGHQEGVTSVDISLDGIKALSGSKDKTVRLWNLITGNCLYILNGHTDCINSVKISPDGRFALSGSRDKTLKYWSLTTGKEVLTLEGHSSYVTSVALSPDGRFALSASADKTILIWDLKTGALLSKLKNHKKWITALSLGANGRYVLSGSKDQTLGLWELQWEYEFPDPADWDESARSYLETFLILHCPYGEDGISRIGKPVWDDNEFKKLISNLENRGYGWLRPEGVRRELEKMTREWQGPPPLPMQ